MLVAFFLMTFFLSNIMNVYFIALQVVCPAPCPLLVCDNNPGQLSLTLGHAGDDPLHRVGAGHMRYRHECHVDGCHRACDKAHSPSAGETVLFGRRGPSPLQPAHRNIVEVRESPGSE